MCSVQILCHWGAVFILERERASHSTLKLMMHYRFLGYVVNFQQHFYVASKEMGRLS
jgi:hypothetical protein